jgi:hypothetical protein
MSEIKCPSCDDLMVAGWLSMFNPILGMNFVAWQQEKPGYVRLRVPQGGEKVIVPRAGGKGCPQSNICKQCKTVVFSYAEDQLD